MKKKKHLRFCTMKILFEQCYKLSKKLNKKYRLIFISSSFFDSLSNLDLPHIKLKNKNIKAIRFMMSCITFIKISIRILR